MSKEKQIKMRGTPSHYHYGSFEIERVDGAYLGLPESRYAYELRFKEQLVKRFEYQKDARKYLDKIINEYRNIQKTRNAEDLAFMKKYGLSSFPQPDDA